jgi:hypothetical protein
MEATMTNRTIKHEVKLQKSVIVILAVLAIGVCANAFAPAFAIKEALAAATSLSGAITVYCKGCY